MTLCFCSWSGGKDSCLALYKATNLGYSPQALLTMCIENGMRSRSHGLALSVLQAQADALNLPLITQNTTWSAYQEHFIAQLKKLKEQSPKITTGIFGDIDIEENGRWEHTVCQAAKLKAVLPLWKMPREQVIEDFLNANFCAYIVAVDAKKLNADFLGRMLDRELITHFKKLNIDPCGENGEYHTVVIDGPLFQYALHLESVGKPLLRANYWFQDFQLKS